MSKAWMRLMIAVNVLMVFMAAFALHATRALVHRGVWSPVRYILPALTILVGLGLIAKWRDRL